VSNLVEFQHDFIAGIDIGQVNDSTAIGVIERIRAVPKLEGLHYALHELAREQAAAVPQRLDLVHLQRIPLGTTYPVQVDTICGLLREPVLRDAPTYLDATGVGLGPFQMLKKAGVRNLHSIKITSSTGPAKRVPEGWNVGKAELVNSVQIEMQTGRLRIGRKIPNADTLVRELKEFRTRQSPNGSLSFNAREGQHDDLVLAVSYAVFGALRPRAVTDFPVRFAA
jgi:hypothetical protein